jgi:addiction module RelB/DinJ family antitoxin
MAQININIRMDEALKRDFESVCGDLGLTMTTAFTVFAKAVTSRKEIPFRVASQKIPVEPSEKTFAKEAWGRFPGERLRVDEVAGIAYEWANLDLIPLEKNAWPEAAAEKEQQRLDESKMGLLP